eukprot:TRINITY_DN3531_c0_g1_i1.p1 TRINITY_DN3531_c0_g1~~TRINITY_DN3531_c0_g1_i1.p1  ORF type:complete len:126 (+),score=15.52 TRINITY_DN3531_c0_g1_i1:56-433(+)
MGCLACLIGQAACCAVKSVKCCCCFLPWSKAIESKLTCVVLFLFALLLGYTLQHNLGDLLIEKYPNLLTAECDKVCWSNVAVYRTTFSLVIYHGFQVVIFLGASESTDPRAKLQNGFWGIKWPLV